MLFNSFPIIEVLLLVVTFLNADYKKGCHRKYLIEDMAYSLSLAKAAEIIFKLSSFFLSKTKYPLRARLLQVTKKI